MQSRIEGRNYLILPCGDDEPYKVNKNKLDKSLEKIEKALETISDELETAYDDCRGNNYDRYLFLKREVLEPNGFEVDEGKLWVLQSLLYDLKDIRKQLEEGNDDFPAERPISETTLSDLGYEHYILGFNAWEKKLEMSDEREVIEEIQMVDGNPIRHRRTILYEKTDYGRSSTDISYMKFPIGKKLMEAIINTYSKKEKEN